MLVALLASIVALMSAQPTGAPSSDVRVSTAQVGSQRVRYIDWGGSGEPFVLLPARCDSPFVYGDLAPFLTKHLRVLSPWTRGCPGAEPSSGEMGIDQQIADLVAFLDAMGLQRATFAGHSASGGKVVRLARQFPARVSRIITLDIICAGVPDAFEERFQGAISSALPAAARREQLAQFAKSGTRLQISAVQGSHYLFVDRPAEVAALILAFLPQPPP